MSTKVGDFALAVDEIGKAVSRLVAATPEHAVELSTECLRHAIGLLRARAVALERIYPRRATR